MEQVQTSASSVFSGSSIYLSDDFLDFSMPSYGSSVGDSTAKAKASDNAPSFANPFSDFNFKAPSMPSFKSDDDAPAAVVEDKEVEQSRKAEEKAEEKAAAESQKAEEKAAAESQKAADKAAAEAQKADEKADQKAAKEAAAEAKKAEKEAAEAKKQADAEQAATKKAEKEARRQAELEKQRLAVERARENDEAPAPVSSCLSGISLELNPMEMDLMLFFLSRPSLGTRSLSACVQGP
jgi:flagellar biosynthesis GTPase FlhF